MRLHNAFLYMILPALAVSAQNAGGGISAEMLSRLESSTELSSSDRALRNAINRNPIDKLALNCENPGEIDTNFSHKVDSKGITNQKSSGRCWLFTGLNVLRSQMMAQNDLGELTLSQNYNFFYDQLEKSNLFLQSIIDSADRPLDDKRVDWLLQNPIGDGGQYTGVADLIMKYGVVPSQAMRETISSESTSRMSQLIGLKLREDALRLREMAAAGASPEGVMAEKERMLAEIYRMLVLTLGQPPHEFTWTRKDSKGKVVDTRTYTPQEFYKEFCGNNLRDDFVMVMNDPSRPYNKLYEIDLDRHVYDGGNWRYINLPIEDIKLMAIESIKDSTMMYFSCDVGKFLNRENGVLDPDNYDYGSLLGVTFGMDKRERVQTHASGSSHAMTLMAVDLDDKGAPKKWMVENSWGEGPNRGHLIMTDKWFDEYMFRLVVNKKYVPKEILKILEQQPEMLPPWDPMFQAEE